MTSAKVFGGYHAIALPLPHSSFQRFVFAKRHIGKAISTVEGILATGRTAYVVNLPTSTSCRQIDDLCSAEEWLRACFEPLGAIQHIVAGSGGLFVEREQLEEEGENVLEVGASRTAHVVFKTEESLNKMLQVDLLGTPAPLQVGGLQAYAARYRRNRPGLSVLKDMADRFMASFDAAEAECLRQRNEKKNQVDDDGYHVVVNRKKRGVIQAEEVLARPVKKRKSNELDNFYRFQTREKKRDQLKTLRERFQEDRHVVEKLKKANKYQPE
uniref:Ribosomal RNA-processing protein 7 C-terminal domain-containing protein n=1 Tax=Hyaloperonospora arabidopsidis (strain Emoy2) TaxID=559515 RepID=M4BU35_HYAAE